MSEEHILPVEPRSSRSPTAQKQFFSQGLPDVSATPDATTASTHVPQNFLLPKLRGALWVNSQEANAAETNVIEWQTESELFEAAH